MRIAFLAATAMLASCAGQPQTEYWHDFTGAHRTQTSFNMDEAACEYQMQAAAVSAPYAPPVAGAGYVNPGVGQAVGALSSIALSGPGPRFFNLCMKAKGWEKR